ncbi:MAG TPA: BREX-1 system adenine-specific DNA-methyltransferase PglX, partial [bacterium]|nr:BREX-1 system adenine-specific DNA-methyltransferase PglX [bacterium]
MREAKNLDDKREMFLSGENRFFVSEDDFNRIPGSPIAYWVSDKIRQIFNKSFILKKIGDTRQGCATSDNNRFLRFWHEVNFSRIGLECATREEALKAKRRWFPYNKGGDFRRWYGNQEFVVDWENDGARLLGYASELYGSATRTIKSISEYFKPSISWSKVTVSDVALRYYPKGFIFDVAGCSIFLKDEEALNYCLGFLNSHVAKAILKIISPTLNYEAGHMAVMPILNQWKKIKSIPSDDLVDISRADWDSRETSWSFSVQPILSSENKAHSMVESFERYQRHCYQITEKMKQLEQRNNSLFIEAYELKDELSPDVPIDDITLFANPKYRYKGALTDNQIKERFKADAIKEFISYSAGCMTGRYSLDVPGIIYANAENRGFDPKKYKTFPADEDGIIPITEHEWFDDDAASRLFRFVEVAWDKKGLDENLDFIAEAIGRKSGEPSREVLRRYFVNDFFKDHCQMYKNRPIYWLFSSGKERAFQALVYLHRYNEGTLARMRTEYVLPLQTKIARHIEHLVKDKDAASG